MSIRYENVLDHDPRLTVRQILMVNDCASPRVVIAKICIDSIADQILHFLTTHLCNHPLVRKEFDGTDAEIDTGINECLTQLVNQAMNDFWNHLDEISHIFRWNCQGMGKKIFYKRAPNMIGFELPRLIAGILSSISGTLIRENYNGGRALIFKFIIYAPDPSLSHNFGRNRNRSEVDEVAVMKCISALKAANIPMSRIYTALGSPSLDWVSFFPTCRLKQREDGTYDVLGSFSHDYYGESDLITRAFFFHLENPFQDVSLFVGISSSSSLCEFKDEMNDVMTSQEYHARISGCSLGFQISLDEMKEHLRRQLLTSSLINNPPGCRAARDNPPAEIKTTPTVIVARIWIECLGDMIFDFLVQNFSCYDPLLNEFKRTKEEGDELQGCILELVHQAMNDLWNRLRNIAGRHSPAARDKFFPGEAPTLEGFQLPKFIASILSSIGPLNVNLIPGGYTPMQGVREDRFNITIIYAPDDKSEEFFEVKVDVLQRFMRALISSGIPVGTIDQSGSHSGSFFTTCRAKDIGNCNYDVLGSFGYKNYKRSDAIIACLFPCSPVTSTPFEDVAGIVRSGSSESESLDLSDFQEGMDDVKPAVPWFEGSCSTQFSEPTETSSLARNVSAKEMEARLTQWLLHGYD